jgi:hypothetical protein
MGNICLCIISLIGGFWGQVWQLRWNGCLNLVAVCGLDVSGRGSQDGDASQRCVVKFLS